MMPFSAIVLCVVLTIVASDFSLAAEPNWQELQNLPDWARTVFHEKTFASTFGLSTRINPFFLHGDFNGDGKLDVAVLITQKKFGQQGIAFAHAGSSIPLIVGAGTKLGNGDDDFSWLDAWSVYVKQPVRQGAPGKKLPVLRGNALFVQKLESASGLIYWDGTTYRWYQQGD